MTQHYVDTNRRKMLGMIEILNDKGHNILHIDNTFVLFTTFEPADSSINANYITVRGQDITTEIENAMEKNGYTEQLQIELLHRISNEPNRLREYSANEPWIKYLAKGG